MDHIDQDLTVRTTLSVGDREVAADVFLLPVVFSQFRLRTPGCHMKLPIHLTACILFCFLLQSATMAEKGGSLQSVRQLYGQLLPTLPSVPLAQCLVTLQLADVSGQGR